MELKSVLEREVVCGFCNIRKKNIPTGRNREGSLMNSSVESYRRQLEPLTIQILMQGLDSGPPSALELKQQKISSHSANVLWCIDPEGLRDYTEKHRYPLRFRV